MNENSSSPTRCDYTAAFLLLRLFLGLRTLIAGLEKFEANKSFSFSNYTENMNRVATAIANYSIIPGWATQAFAMSLGFLLVIFGAAILLGIKTRAALFFGGLVYVGLGFGLMAVQEGEGVAWIGMQVLMFAVALTLVRNNRFALVADKHCA
ncbi:MAG: DoxX family membrane protein [Opitutaceae bacterium]|nr:DoxX family membrane protein [Opitutaceae bacterium]